VAPWQLKTLAMVANEWEGGTMGLVMPINRVVQWGLGGLTGLPGSGLCRSGGCAHGADKMSICLI
jgi:hypothetical protein